MTSSTETRIRLCIYMLAACRSRTLGNHTACERVMSTLNPGFSCQAHMVQSHCINRFAMDRPRNFCARCTKALHQQDHILSGRLSCCAHYTLLKATIPYTAPTVNVKSGLRFNKMLPVKNYPQTATVSVNTSPCLTAWLLGAGSGKSCSRSRRCGRCLLLFLYWVLLKNMKNRLKCTEAVLRYFAGSLFTQQSGRIPNIDYWLSDIACTC